jgi:GNAT superfamily N-acetyltransferase
MQVLYTQADGSKLIYEREDGELVFGYVIRPDGKQYPTKPVESILARGYWEVAEEVFKHGEHDQKTHGSWATGATIATGIIDRLGKKGVTGFSLDISSRSEPTSGYMASNAGSEETVSYDDFFSSRDRSRKILLDYIEKNADALSERGAYFGIWVVKDQGSVYLDVSRRYDTRGEAVRSGFENDQQSVYDIENDEYIYMKDEEDERTRKAVDDGSSNPRQSNDSRAEASLRGRDSQRNREESPHVCLGRYQGVEKHLEGQHDQATHGSWASGRFGPDSVKSARDGAKEYAFKAGIEQDDSIDYQKTVANRARAERIAAAYDELPTVEEEAFPAYTALATEVEAQFDYMTKTMGIKVEFVADDPYKTSREMFADVSKGVLKVLSTASTGSHPFLSDEQNDKFRAVHDFFGHAATGRGFGQDGEESAWVHHSQMFTETARGALTTETRGQNSWYNSRGKVFAEQKVALLPKEFWEVPKTFEKQYKVIKFQAGLIPILKHQEHDQRTHGSWANQGYTAEEEARIAEMSSMGPALADLDEILESVSIANPSMDEFRLIVENDRDMYEAATEDIDAKVEEELARLFPDGYTEQDKNGIYEIVQRDMIRGFIEENSDDLQAEYAASRGLGDTEELLGQAHAFFDDVYTYDYEVKGPNGESGTMSAMVGSVEIGNHPYDGSQNGIKLTGTVQFDGEYAGEFERTFWKDENGNWNVEHDLFRMEDEYQGTGFGKEFIQRQEDWYTAAGFSSVIVGTGWDGARHWARAGYDFNERYIESNMNQLASAMNVEASSGGGYFQNDSPERIEFDRLMFRATTGFQTDSDGVQFTGVRPMTTDEDFPLPNDFAMVGYATRTSYKTTNAMGEEVTAYAWAGKTLLQNLNLKYKKILTAEGRSLNDGPIDRDGDGMVFDGTAREKPAPRVNS